MADSQAASALAPPILQAAPLAIEAALPAALLIAPKMLSLLTPIIDNNEPALVGRAAFKALAATPLAAPAIHFPKVATSPLTAPQTAFIAFLTGAGIAIILLLPQAFFSAFLQRAVPRATKHGLAAPTSIFGTLDLAIAAALPTAFLIFPKMLSLLTPIMDNNEPALVGRAAFKALAATPLAAPAIHFPKVATSPLTAPQTEFMAFLTGAGMAIILLPQAFFSAFWQRAVPRATKHGLAEPTSIFGTLD